jgi:hypothetical protein
MQYGRAYFVAEREQVFQLRFFKRLLGWQL